MADQCYTAIMVARATWFAPGEGSSGAARVFHGPCKAPARWRNQDLSDVQWDEESEGHCPSVPESPGSREGLASVFCLVGWRLW